MTEKVAAKSLVAGDHGTTYGGNPLACAAIKKTLDLFGENNIIEHVAEVGEYLKAQLEIVVSEFDCVQMRRGIGLMQGLVFDKPVGQIIAKAMEKGLILISAGTDVIRFLPPLIITKEDVDTMTAILREAIKEA